MIFRSVGRSVGLRVLVWLSCASAGMVSIIPAGARASPLTPDVTIAPFPTVEGEGLGVLSYAEVVVSPFHVVFGKIFESSAPIDLNLRVHDQGGNPKEYLFYEPLNYNLTFEPWLGFRHQLGYKDAAGVFHPSNERDGLAFVHSTPLGSPFLSDHFAEYAYGPGLDTLDWSRGELPSPSDAIFLFSIRVPASNPAMPSFALRDGGYEFTLREIPIVTWDNVPGPPIIPEPPSIILLGIGLVGPMGYAWWRPRPGP